MKMHINLSNASESAVRPKDGVLTAHLSDGRNRLTIHYSTKTNKVWSLTPNGSNRDVGEFIPPSQGFNSREARSHLIESILVVEPESDRELADEMRELTDNNWKPGK